MNAIFTAALELQSFCRQRGWQSCIIGGLAVLRWGRPRATQDVDLSLLTGFGHEDEFIKPLLEKMAPRITDAERFAADHRVLLLRASNGVPLDVTLAALPLEERIIQRSSTFDFASDCSLVTASAEDLIVMKAFADRTKDWADVEGILSQRADRLDWATIEAELRPLCEIKESFDVLRRLEALRGGAFGFDNQNE
ncbi:MAG TPA: nucleotidyl transferase AbiEii/AbiGii toxin family protein [Pirellulales bacterium]|nr:nucleotidyl transferase AbiEii/AbiGii toxin family protein [Pirellulales bacterium]